MRRLCIFSCYWKEGSTLSAVIVDHADKASVTSWNVVFVRLFNPAVHKLSWSVRTTLNICGGGNWQRCDPQDHALSGLQGLFSTLLMSLPASLECREPHGALLPGFLRLVKSKKHNFDSFSTDSSMGLPSPGRLAGTQVRLNKALVALKVLQSRDHTAHALYV